MRRYRRKKGLPPTKHEKIAPISRTISFGKPNAAEKIKEPIKLKSQEPEKKLITIATGI
jgi:hypothetical protein